jgi:hypothetical protein
MHSELEVSGVPSGLEVALPSSQENGNPGTRRSVPSYTAPSTTQDAKEGSKYPSEAGGLPQRRRNPWGLSPLMFGLLVALITLIIVGAALGGGLGGSLASARKKNACVIPCSVPAHLKLGMIPISNAHKISLQCSNPVLNNYCVIYHILDAYDFVHDIHNIHNRGSRHLQ